MELPGNILLRTHEAEFVPIDKWPMNYRFTNPKWSQLPEEAVKTIRPLSDMSGAVLEQRTDYGELTRQARCNELSPEWEVHDIDPEDASKTRAWLESKPIPPTRDVYVLWSYAPNCTAIAAWQTFVTFFDDFGYSFEVLLVTDDTREWEVLVGPNEHVRWRKLGR